MKCDRVAFTHIDGVPSEKHIIRMPDYYDKGWYTSSVSIDAFDRRESTRFYKIVYIDKLKMQGKHTLVQRLGEWDDNNKAVAERIKESHGIDYVHPNDQLPTFEHESVFDFYIAIGYDYKKKRYI